MKLTLAKARRVLEDAEVAVAKARMPAVLEVSPFDSDAESNLEKTRQSVLRQVNERARALDVLSSMRTQLAQAEMECGLLHLQNEELSAEDYMVEAEDLLNAYHSVKAAEQKLPDLFSSFDEVRKIKVSFPVLDDDTAAELQEQVDRAHGALKDIRDRIAEARAINRIDLASDQVDILRGLVMLP